MSENRAWPTEPEGWSNRRSSHWSCYKLQMNNSGPYMLQLLECLIFWFFLLFFPYKDFHICYNSSSPLFFLHSSLLISYTGLQNSFQSEDTDLCQQRWPLTLLQTRISICLFSTTHLCVPSYLKYSFIESTIIGLFSKSACALAFPTFPPSGVLYLPRSSNLKPNAYLFSPLYIPQISFY